MKIVSIDSELMEYMDILEELQERVFGGPPHLKPAEREFYGATRRQLVALWEYSPEAFIIRMGQEKPFSLPMIKFWLREKWQDGVNLCSTNEIITIYAWYLFSEAEAVKKAAGNLGSAV